MLDVRFSQEPENEFFHELDRTELMPIDVSLFSNMIWFGDFSIENDGCIFLMENVPLMAIANQLLYRLPDIALYKAKITIVDSESPRMFEVEEATQDAGETKLIKFSGNFTDEVFWVNLEILYTRLRLASLVMYKEVIARYPELHDSLMLKMYLLAF